jgi:uncharacterized membrane protein SirB2
MGAFYPQVKMLHMLAVLSSGTLFFLRGMALNVFGAAWPMAAPVRYLSYTVDTVLLIAALMLTAIIHQYPFVHPWLTVKVLLLLVYIGLGTFALKRGRTANVRIGAWVAALAVFAFIASVALTHNPLGLFTML